MLFALVKIDLGSLAALFRSQLLECYIVGFFLFAVFLVLLCAVFPLLLGFVRFLFIGLKVARNPLEQRRELIRCRPLGLFRFMLLRQAGIVPDVRRLAAAMLFLFLGRFLPAVAFRRRRRRFRVKPAYFNTLCSLPLLPVYKS